MPTDQPSNVPAGTAPEPRDEAAPGAVLTDERLDTTPGGGGLGGSSAAEALGGAAPTGGPAPNAPIDPYVAGGDTAAAADEAQGQLLATTPSTGGRSDRA